TFMQDLKNKPKAKPLLTGMEPATEDEGESIKSVKSVKGASAKGDSLPMVAEDAAQYDDGEIRETSILDQEDEQEFYAEDVEADEERLPEADEDEELG
nr:hypothetical protein [bacterium]